MRFKDEASQDTIFESDHSRSEFECICIIVIFSEIIIYDSIYYFNRKLFHINKRQNISKQETTRYYKTLFPK